MTVHVYTSFTFSYLARARVLADSLKRLHPEWVTWAVVTDRPPEGFHFDIENEPFDRLIFGEDLYPGEWASWVFKRDIVEACTGVKGRALLRILGEPDATKVIYLDPDIAVFNSLARIENELDSSDIVLTPHRVSPPSSDNLTSIFDNEVAGLRHGVFNLGFIAIARREEGLAFAKWWAERLDLLGYDDLHRGLFVDQLWCNYIPCYFESVKILRDPGYNVASWNLTNRHIHYSDSGDLLSNGELLRFYHFTKFGPVGKAMTMRYGDDNLEVYELWWWYKHQLDARSDDRIPPGWWHYARLKNGEEIRKEWRLFWRDKAATEALAENPFELTGEFFERHV